MYKVMILVYTMDTWLSPLFFFKSKYVFSITQVYNKVQRAAQKVHNIHCF